MRYFVLFLPPLLGCAENALSAKGEAPADTGEPDFTEDTAVDSASPPVDETPAWFALGATLTVAEAQPVAAGVTVTMVVYADPPGEPLCEVTPTLFGVAAGVPPDPAITTWWEMDLVAAAACAILPSHLGLGIGSLHPDVRARLGADELDAVADSLYGAYARVDEGAAYAYGYAATKADLAGDNVAKPPPPDGTYAIVPVYLLGLPEQD